MTKPIFLSPAAKYLKKLKNKQLKTLYQNAIDEICKNPSRRG